MERTSFGPFVSRPCGPLPLGATVAPNGVRFAIFSRHATRLWLELFDEPQGAEPVARIELSREHHRTGDIWSVHVDGLGAGQLYAYRAEGPYEPGRGHRFNPYKLLLDPYARAVTGTFDWDLGDARGAEPQPGAAAGDLSVSTVDSAGGCPKCIVMHDDFDWQGDRPLRIPMHDTVIYELHVRGFTVHPSAGVAHPGSFRGLMEKIPYLVELGVTAVELLPIQEFDERENPRRSPVTGELLGNYWGYSTVSFFAPESRYASDGQQVREFKELVRALHRAGIEVILDVVFNHTSEGDETGPTLCFRGLDNRIYYMLDSTDPQRYMNLTGCGNTLNCNHPLVRDFILDCLRYWVVEMHVDGFRFDLASVLGRDQDGQLMANPPLVERIAEDPVLRDCKIIAEAWDAAGAYQVGSFPGERWAEWNGQYRDDIRRFWRGDAGLVGALATRFSGSADLYQGSGRTPLHSINFVTCHDGFTLADLVTYERKRNWSNGESNRDGTDANHAWSCGAEGPTDDASVLALRDRQLRNFLATLLLSQGVPMLLAGDELRRTQRGNNNAYCQDNEISWLDWTLLERHGALQGYVTALIRLRRRFPELRRSAFFTGDDGLSGRPDISWHSTRLGRMDWSAECRSLACWINADPDLYVIFNASTGALDFELPSLPVGRWQRVLDTADDAGRYLLELDQAEGLPEPTRYPVQPHSMVVLVCQ